MKPALNHLAIVFTLALLLYGTTAIAGASRPAAGAGPKYVFFFLGDGMSSAQIQSALAYKTCLNGGNEQRAGDLRAAPNTLHLMQLPVAGLATTYADSRFITDSAAAATAFACGIKTIPGALGRGADLTTSYKSIAELARENGRAIGIISSASLPHATPAGYYANVNSRNNYGEIGYQASQSGFDFFGGGRFTGLDEAKNSDGIVLRQAFADAGYTFINDKTEILALRDKQAGKVVCSVATSHDADSMPFAIDRPPENFSLAQITDVAINYLQSDPEGFFILVEGGKIDWACHANDAVSAMIDLLAFDDAIGTALAFLEKHPSETLIVVTGDHETGGLGLGFRGTRYQTAYNILRGQTKSGKRFIAEDLAQYRKTHTWENADTNIDDNMKALFKSCFGLEWDQLSDVQHEQLETAYDATCGGLKPDSRPSGYDLDGAADVFYLEYGGTDPLTVSLTHILNQEAGIGWTTSGHTAIPVPVMAAGQGAPLFTGFYDNTDIAKKLGVLMDTPPLPVEDREKRAP